MAAESGLCFVDFSIWRSGAEGAAVAAGIGFFEGFGNLGAEGFGNLGEDFPISMGRSGVGQSPRWVLSVGPRWKNIFHVTGTQNTSRVFMQVIGNCIF